MSSLQHLLHDRMRAVPLTPLWRKPRSPVRRNDRCSSSSVSSAPDASDATRRAWNASFCWGGRAHVFCFDLIKVWMDG